MSSIKPSPWRAFGHDLSAGLVVFLVALPLCLGIALASKAPLFSGILTGIVAGLVVAVISGSQTSVSGPSAGTTAIVAMQIALLGSFEAFLLALCFAGLIQIILGALRAGVLSAFVPTSVVKGLMAAIGLLLILKQIPHVLGHDADPEGDMAFQQVDRENTFSEFGEALWNLHPGTVTLGIVSFALLLLWDSSKHLKKIPIPGPLVVVLLGVGMAQLFNQWGGEWAIAASHMVQVPIISSLGALPQFLNTPDFSQWANPAVYLAALFIALATSLETLLNLEAVDNVDPQQRVSPPNRELVAQGVGNILCGLIGGLPCTSVIVRSSVNLNAGAQSKLSAIFHGVLMAVCALFFAPALNSIPLASLAAILLMTGCKLFNPSIFLQMRQGGRTVFLPFLATVIAIVFTDIIRGILLGMSISIAFILYSNLRRPLRVALEKHLDCDVTRIEFASQVSFLNRAALDRVLNEIPRGGHVLLDARRTVYVDPDIVALIRDFKETAAPARGITVSFWGFQRRGMFPDDIQYPEFATREIQQHLTPEQVLTLLQEGNARFRAGRTLTRDLNRQLQGTSGGQHPLAVVLSCIDSRSPAELIFDLGLGDIFSIRIAGNVTSGKVLGSIEYGTAVAGAKLILVLGHTRCGAVTAAVDFAYSGKDPCDATGCQHLSPIVEDIQLSLDGRQRFDWEGAAPEDRQDFVNEIARRNVRQSIQRILAESETIRRLVETRRVGIVGAIFDIASGEIELLPDAPAAASELIASRAS